MDNRSFLRLYVFLSLGLLLTSCGSSPDYPISSFADINWGADRQAIYREYGNVFEKRNAEIREIFEESGESGVTLRYDNVSLKGRKISLEFYLHPQSGLVKGVYYFPLPRKGTNCNDFYREVLGLFEDKMEAMTKREIKKNKLEQDFCSSLSRKKAKWVTIWKDQDTGFQVIQYLGPISYGNILVLFETPTYERWKDRLDREELIH